ncbi:divalent-cation tolerance protein CutA [Litorilituus lipolyticus]|uniref:Divalent-cation tolerance protein CutA n=1 Tax=Litorilituus lipolyticus TaxID=2491017 RepID=A0A502KUC6_9GAMM|nr:divalent-cation tolerance protein CutA [Litorilituus lipolyticus]TPH15096.1 divalent-cation tolerance protein CutA [Litorilituus lipolyticus]
MYQLVLTTCPDIAVAKTIAEILVSKKLAACVNIVPNITSVYQWQGEMHCDEEVQLIIKTLDTVFTQLKEEINLVHPYDVVEIIALNVQQGDEHYLNWISNALN